MTDNPAKKPMTDKEKQFCVGMNTVMTAGALGMGRVKTITLTIHTLANFIYAGSKPGQRSTAISNAAQVFALYGHPSVPAIKADGPQKPKRKGGQ